MAFRPRPVPTVFTVIGVAILIALGTWQLHRRVWKEELLATIAARSDAAPVPLPQKIDHPGRWSFRRVRIAGHFDTGHAFWLYGRVYEGKAGVHLLVPMIRPDGPVVLVDRGFVPFAENKGLESFAAVDGPTEVEGIVRLPEPGGWFMPSNQPDQNIWYSVAPKLMAARLGMTLLPVYVAAIPSGKPGWPAGTGGTERSGIRNQHLNYAIFWYTMAVALTVIYVLSSRSRSA